MHIRLGQVEDLQACRLIEDDAAGIFGDIGMSEIEDDAPTDLEILREAQGESRLWVGCDSNDVPVAFVYVRLVEENLYIQELDVARSYQRRGIGGQLVEAVCHAARERGCAAVTLSTFADVPWNAPYYGRLGFDIIPHRDLTPGLLTIEAEEAAFGLDISRRVFMQRNL